MISRRGMIAGGSVAAIATAAHGQAYLGRVGFRSGFQFPNAITPYVGAVASVPQAVNNNLATSPFLYSMSRTRHRAAQDISTATQLQVGLPNWYVNSTILGIETGCNGTITYRASIEYPSGTIIGQCLFSASASGVAANFTTLMSDPVSMSGTIPSGAYFFVRIKATGSAGFPFASGTTGNSQDYTNGECSQYQSSDMGDLTTTGGTFTNTSGTTGNILRPALIVGLTTLPSAFLLGDSRCMGLKDAHTDSSGDMGEIARSLGAANIAYVNAGVSGDRGAWFLASRSRRMELAAYCSHVVMETGINDLSDANASDATLRTTMSSLRSLFSSRTPAFLSTLAPETNSTDSWATTTNQTARSPLVLATGRRETQNDWRRTVPTGFSGCFEVSDAVETARNSGLWKVNGTANYFTVDGIHENYTSAIAIQAAGAITQSSFVVASAPNSLAAYDLTQTLTGFTTSGGANGTIVNSSGLIVAASAPRLSYDPVSLAVAGLLIEPAATNLAFPSSGTLGGSNGNGSVTVGGTSSPLGATSGSTFTDNSTSGAHNISTNSVAATSGQYYCVSGFFKAGTLSRVQFTFSLAAFAPAAGLYADFNLSTGVVTASSQGAQVKMEPYGNGWYRCSMSAIATATASSSAIIYASNSDTATRSPSYVGSSQTFFYDGIQIEQGYEPTSYIPTTSAAVTRSADAITTPSLPSGTNHALCTFKGGAKQAFFASSGAYAVATQPNRPFASLAAVA